MTVSQGMVFWKSFHVTMGSVLGEGSRSSPAHGRTGEWSPVSPDGCDLGTRGPNGDQTAREAALRYWGRARGPGPGSVWEV